MLVRYEESQFLQESHENDVDLAESEDDGDEADSQDEEVPRTVGGCHGDRPQAYAQKLLEKIRPQLAIMGHRRNW